MNFKDRDKSRVVNVSNVECLEKRTRFPKGCRPSTFKISANIIIESPFPRPMAEALVWASLKCKEMIVADALRAWVKTLPIDERVRMLQEACVELMGEAR